MPLLKALFRFMIDLWKQKKTNSILNTRNDESPPSRGVFRVYGRRYGHLNRGEGCLPYKRKEPRFEALMLVIVVPRGARLGRRGGGYISVQLYPPDLLAAWLAM